MELTITDGGRDECFVHKRSYSLPECECDGHSELDLEADAASPVFLSWTVSPSHFQCKLM